MVSWFGRRGRLVRSSSVAVLVVGGALVASATPAQAGPACHVTYTLDYSNGMIDGASYPICDPGIPIPSWARYVEIERQDPVTGAWTFVAGGRDTVTYTCVGTSTHTFRTGEQVLPSPIWQAQITAPCE